VRRLGRPLRKVDRAADDFKGLGVKICNFCRLAALSPRAPSAADFQDAPATRPAHGFDAFLSPKLLPFPSISGSDMASMSAKILFGRFQPRRQHTSGLKPPRTAQLRLSIPTLAAGAPFPGAESIFSSLCGAK